MMYSHNHLKGNEVKETDPLHRVLLKDDAQVVQIFVMPAWGIILVVLNAESGSTHSELMPIYPGQDFVNGYRGIALVRLSASYIWRRQFFDIWLLQIPDRVRNDR